VLVGVAFARALARTITLWSKRNNAEQC
jgi:hypothetical protein